jgi:3-oxoadipate enol-lactonase
MGGAGPPPLSASSRLAAAEAPVDVRAPRTMPGGATPGRFIDADGILLHVRCDGRGEGTCGSADAVGHPPLVYLHSLGTELRIWDPLIARLPGRLHVRLDLRGHGLSEVPTGPYRIADMAGDVLAVLADLEIERAVLVGVSIGGQIALRVALERPRSVRGLVALDTAARIGDRATWNARMDEVRAGGLEAIADAVVARWFAPSIAARDPMAQRGYRNLLLRTPVAGYLAACAALRDEDLRARLGAIDCPSLVLCGSEDTATPPALVRGLAAALPRARYREIEDAGHLPCIDRPDRTARHLASFRDDLASD